MKFDELKILKYASFDWNNLCESRSIILYRENYVSVCIMIYNWVIWIIWSFLLGRPLKFSLLASKNGKFCFRILCWACVYNIEIFNFFMNLAPLFCHIWEKSYPQKNAEPHPFVTSSMDVPIGLNRKFSPRKPQYSLNYINWVCTHSLFVTFYSYKVFSWLTIYLNYNWIIQTFFHHSNVSLQSANYSNETYIILSIIWYTHHNCFNFHFAFKLSWKPKQKNKTFPILNWFS